MTATHGRPSGSADEHRGLSERFTPLAPPQLEELHALFAELRREEPVFYSEPLDLWVATRYDDMLAIVTDRTAFSIEGALDSVVAYTPEARRILDEAVPPGTASLANSDGADSDRLRASVSRTLTPRRVAALEPRIAELSREVITTFASDGHADLVTQFAKPLPLRVILDFIGFPSTDVAQIGQWTADWITLHFGQPSDEEQVRHAQGVADHYGYVRDFLAARRNEPREDFASVLLQSVDSGETTISDDELVLLLATNLTLAAHDAMTSALSSGVLHLMRHRSEWDAMRSDPERAQAVVEELFRFDPPGSFFRKTLHDVELGGRVLPAGARIMFYIPSVNRDESKFEAPDEFRPGRSDAVRHLTFSIGHHHCLGAALARVEARAALTTLSRMLPDMHLRPDQVLEYEPAIPVRLLQHLLVEWDVRP